MGNYSFTDHAITVLKKRYLKEKSNGQTETPQELFWRVAESVAEADLNYGATEDDIQALAQMFFEVMVNCEFMPNSPALMNAGTNLGQLSACFVLPVEDSMEGIFDAVKNAALIHKTGGGTGFSFSRLRPKNSIVQTTKGVASGPVSFMKVFNAATEAVKQGGTRRGANMGILRCDHPDIEEFISCKSNLSEMTNFNLSVAITDAFMIALEEERNYSLFDPKSKSVVGTRSAIKIFDMIAEHAWQTGEPGIIFIDEINRQHTTDETVEATNPCGEQPLPPYDSCNLASINLAKCVANHTFDFSKLERLVKIGVHFLDNLIDINKFPLPEIKEQTLKNRRIGLGVMGFADALIEMGIPYGSPKSFQWAEKIMKFIQEHGHMRSSDLGARRGNFPNWSNSVYADKDITMRNGTVTTIAPTGTISIIAGCSSGIEPIYSVVYKRTVLEGTEMFEVHPIFERVAKKLGFYSDDLIQRIAEKGSIQGFEEIPLEIRHIYMTAADVEPDEHILIQSSFQRFCDSSVSKTINLPSSATVDDVKESYLLAYREQLKGITVYRDGSRPNQVLSTGKTVQKKELIASRPEVLHGFTKKVQTGHGNLYVTINALNHKPFEVFASIGKSGFSSMADTEGICRMVSLALRAGVPADKIVKQLKGIGGAQPVFANGGRILSIPDAIGGVLQEYFGDGEKHHDVDIDDEFCPDCLAALVHEGGCISCKDCGYSKC